MFIRQRNHKIVNDTTRTTRSFPHSNTCDEQTTHTQNKQEFVEFNALQGRTRLRFSHVNNNRVNGLLMAGK